MKLKLLIGAALFFAANSAFAITYDYVGTPYTQKSGPQAGVGDFLSASFTFDDSVVTNNFTGTVADETSITNWSVTSGATTVVKGVNAQLFTTNTKMFTFENGVITHWDYWTNSVTGPLAGGYLNSFNSVDENNGSPQDVVFSFDVAGSPLAYNDGIAGTWTKVQVAAVPEPDAYAMMLAGVVLVGAVSRKRKSV